MASINKYVWIVICSVAMFIFSPKRSQDPIAAAIISITTGFLLLVVVLVFDFVVTPIRKKLTVNATKKLTTQRGMPEISMAAADGDDNRIADLLVAGADVDQSDAKGGTALMYAAINDRRSTVRLLLKSGADPAKKNQQGKTAKDIAKMKSHLVMVDILNEFP